MLLHAIMTLAFAEDRVPENPVRKVIKPRQETSREVPPVPPATVDRLRARLGTRDGAIVAVLAYAGRRPQELLALKWEDVPQRVIRVRRKCVNGELFEYTKTRQNRNVKLLAPHAADLAEWALASGRRTGLVFPGHDGEPWTKTAWSNWRRRVYEPAARAVGLSTPIPYDLRGSFVSLLVGGLQPARGLTAVRPQPRGLRSPLRWHLRGRRPRQARDRRGRHPGCPRTWSTRSVRAVRHHGRRWHPVRAMFSLHLASWAVAGSNRGPPACKAGALTS